MNSALVVLNSTGVCHLLGLRELVLDHAEPGFRLMFLQELRLFVDLQSEILVVFDLSHVSRGKVGEDALHRLLVDLPREQDLFKTWSTSLGPLPSGVLRPFFADSFLFSPWRARMLARILKRLWRRFLVFYSTYEA